MLPLPLGINSLGKFPPLISGRRLTIYIHGLLPRRCIVSPVGRRRSMLATNLLPVGRGFRHQPGGIQLNRPLFNKCSLGLVRSATHLREGLRRTWRERKGRVAPSAGVTQAMYSQPRGNHAFPSLQSWGYLNWRHISARGGVNEVSTDAANRDHP
jgi:hypothetical protein